MYEIDPVKQEFCDQSNERALMALAVHEEDNFYTLLSKVKESDFLSPDTARLFSILSTLHATGVKKFDVHAIIRVAKELGFTDLCDISYITAITNITVATENFDIYLQRQLDISTKYKLKLQLQNHMDKVVANAKLTSGSSSDDLLSNVQADLLSLSTDSAAVIEPKHVGEGLDEYIDSIKDTKVNMRGLSTGYPILDQKIDGQIPGTLMIIAARKKMGKSTLLTNIALHAAIMENRPVLYIDTEMPFNQWRDRALAIISGVKERTIQHGGFAKDKETLRKILEAVEKLKNSKFFHHFMPGYSVEKITALFHKYKLKENIELGVFDYIKEPDSSTTDAGRKEYQILGDVTTRLKDLAGQLNIPFLAAVQVNRVGDVADSDRVARYGDIVAFWEYRDKKVMEELGADMDVCGHYQLTIKDSRRGGATPATGIGFKFAKRKLIIREVTLPDQIGDLFDAEEVEDYKTGLNETINNEVIEDDGDTLR